MLDDTRHPILAPLLFFLIILLVGYVLGGGLAAPDPGRTVTWEDRQEYEDPAYGPYGSGT